ncbi:NKL protein, partial [Atractosteus spatula]|nr:NKL protein [Atractosteus spatula]
MTRIILICLLLASSTLADSGHSDEEDIADAFLEEHGDSQQGLKFRCKACQAIMKIVKKSLPDDATKDDIIQSLHDVCAKMGPLKSVCKGIVKKYLEKLVHELMTDDGPKSACVHIKLCSAAPFPWKEM